MLNNIFINMLRSNFESPLRTICFGFGLPCGSVGEIIFTRRVGTRNAGLLRSQVFLQRIQFGFDDSQKEGGRLYQSRHPSLLFIYFSNIRYRQLPHPVHVEDTAPSYQGGFIQS